MIRMPGVPAFNAGGVHVVWWWWLTDHTIIGRRQRRPRARSSLLLRPRLGPRASDGATQPRRGSSSEVARVRPTTCCGGADARSVGIVIACSDGALASLHCASAQVVAVPVLIHM
ncbi:hypothetical protein HPB50_025490 [Hyalomma asiaticum]|uniref:Uncharacterized protein n=1 Tax=Hyalomma asiaticum TaxID=266040 RepID=A0ACB7SN77_HYAAI|nr:hypothetical protein HPB50_025490 [Hyalomma asiaticum]